jgi:hypothetical protein
MALSNWKSSSLDVSVNLESQHNKFCCFFSIAVQLITPNTQTLIAYAWQYSLQYQPREEHVNCQFPTCSYNTLTIHYLVLNRIPDVTVSLNEKFTVRRDFNIYFSLFRTKESKWCICSTVSCVAKSQHIKRS